MAPGDIRIFPLARERRLEEGCEGARGHVAAGKGSGQGTSPVGGAAPCPLWGGGVVFTHSILVTVVSFIFLRFLEMVLEGKMDAGSETVNYVQ